MPNHPEDQKPGGLSSLDDFDLLSLGLLPQEEEPQEDETPDYPVNLFLSREGYLKKAEAGARAQIARKKAQQQTPEAPKKQP